MKTQTQTLQNKIGSSIDTAIALAPMPSLVPALSPLTDAERAEKMECEAEIEYGLKGLDRLDAALLKMRDKKYYRDEFFTFEEYCTVKLKRTARWARHQIAAARVMQCLKLDLGAPAQLTNGNPGSHQTASGLDAGGKIPEYNLEGAKPFPLTLPLPLPLPDSERVARPLTTLRQEDVRPVWEEAVRTAPGGKVTAKHIEQTVSAFKALRAGPARGKGEDQTAFGRTGLADEGNEAEEEPLCDGETGFELAQPKAGKVQPKVVEIAAARLEPRGDIREANCAHLFQKGPLTAVTIGNGNVFEHDRCNWVTLSQTHASKVEDRLAECYCLVDADRYTGPEPLRGGSSLRAGDYQGYHVILDRHNYRLGPMTIFKPGQIDREASNKILEQHIAVAVPFLRTRGKGTAGAATALRDHFIWDFAHACEVMDAIIDRDLLKTPAPAVIPPKKRDEPKPEVLTVAKKLYLIGSEAAGLTHKWGTATVETHMAFLSVAEFHLKEVRDLEAVIEQLKQRTRDGVTAGWRANEMARKASVAKHKALTTVQPQNTRSGFPKPSEHGVYKDSDAKKGDVFKFSTKGTWAEIRLLETKKGWIHGTRFQTPTGAGLSGLFNTAPHFKNRSAALKGAIKQLSSSFQSVAKDRDGTVKHHLKVPGAKKALAWLKSIYA